MVFLSTDFLVVFVALAGEDDDIAILGMRKGIFDGFLAIGDCHIFAIGLLYAGHDVCNNGLRLLKTGIV